MKENIKKIFFVAPANNIHTVKWVNSLCDDYEVHLIYCSNHDVGVNKVNEKVILHSLKVKAPYGYYLNVGKLRKLYKEIRPDLINVHYASGYGTLVRCSKIKPVLLNIWGSDVYDFPNKSKINEHILRKNVFSFDMIASTSNVMANELKRHFPDYDKKIFITPFGVDIDKFKKYDVKRDDDEIRIANIKALEEKYGISDLILSVKKLKDNLLTTNKELSDKIKLYIYGDGSQKILLEDLIKNNNLSDSVFLMGRIPNTEVPKVLSSMDIFCATSVLNSESFGVAVVEAMACELPVVATDVDGFSEVMINNETGFIVKRKDIESISCALEKLVKDEQSRKLMGKNGRKRVLDNYAWFSNVNTMKQLYCKIIEKKDL